MTPVPTVQRAIQKVAVPSTLVKLLEGMSDAGHTPSTAWGYMWATSLTPAALSDMPDAAVMMVVRLLYSALASRSSGERATKPFEGEAAAQLMATVPSTRCAQVIDAVC
jgi:hypothetical protein